MDLQKWQDRILYYPGSLLLLAWLPGYLKFKQDLNNPLRAQTKKLLAILGANQNTEYGKKYRFHAIKSIQQFQDQVPIVDYHAIRNEIQRLLHGAGNILTSQEPFFFLITSGTTGEPKYIPVTRDFAREYNSPLVFFNLLRHHPKIAYFNAILSIVTTDAAVTKSGLPVGASSGYLYRAQSPVAQLTYTLPYDIFAIDDWDAKYYTILRMSMEKPVRLIITNNPSSLIVLANKAAEFQERLLADLEQGTIDRRHAIPQPLRRTLERQLRPNPNRAKKLRIRLNQEGEKLKPSVLWPELEALCCWVDGPARFYVPQLQQLYGNIPVHNLGYLASEGRGSVPVDDIGDCVLAIHSHFFEFIPVGEESSAPVPVLTCDQLEAGQDYQILFTSSNGLYRYRLDDIIRVKGFRQSTPVIQFQYKAGNTFDFTGEKLYATQIESSMEKVLPSLKVPVVDYTVIPIPGTPPFYCLVVEFGPTVEPGLLKNLAQEFESELIRGNISYAGKLASQLIGPLRLVSVPAGTFENFIKHQVLEAGAPYSHVKIGHLNPHPAFLEYLKTNSLMPDQVRIF